ncbi:fimbrial protein [Entomohabitans teleogrylli]|uniref:fimbrial protein n=1 Tax=Entomohabitans teleogrylli TaxID=1384589 RepID=UPI00073DA33C|nr:fimbrial protein [Entomohabitans teleogrylli]
MFKITQNNLSGLLLLGFILLIRAPFSYAACQTMSVAPNSTYPIPFNSISPNMETGNVLMTVGFYAPSARFTCDSAPGYLVLKVKSTLGKTGTYLGKSPIYKTSIDGLGAYFSQMLDGIRISENDTAAAVVSLVQLNIVKMKSDTISGVLDASTLPTIDIYGTESSSGTSNSGSVTLGSVAFTGNVSYVVPTCMAEEKKVWLGEHNVNYFTDSETTDWEDASITMICDRAFSNAYNYSFTSFSGILSQTIRPENYYSVTLQAVNDFINSSRGIMAIDSNGATGIGIQISRTRSEQKWTSFTWTDLNVEGANTIKIPLYARYIKTADKVTMGQANSKLIYTVQYK